MRRKRRKTSTTWKLSQIQAIVNLLMKKSQKQKFEQAAREAECDTDEKAFEEALKKVAKSPPSKAERKPEEGE